MAYCPTPSPDDPLVGGLIASTDCHVEALVRSGYGALFAPEGAYGAVLTSALVIYIALVGYRLLLGRGGIAIGELALTAVKLGVVLALATQWGTYQTVVYRTVFDGPQQIGDVMLHDLRSQGVLEGGDIYDGLQRAYDDLTAFSPAAPPGGVQANPTSLAATGTPTSAPVAPAAGSSAAPGQVVGGPLGKAGFDSVLLLFSAIALLLSTLGVLLASKLVLGLLLAVGPVFIALLLFESTRGLFMGWLRASLGFAFAPLATSVLLGIGLSLLEPSLEALEAMRDTNTYTPGVAYSVLVLVLVLSGVAVGLQVAAAVVAGGFGTGRTRRAPAAISVQAGASSIAVEAAPILGRTARTAAAAEAQARRDARIFGGAVPAATAAASERRVSATVLTSGVRAAPDAVAIDSRLGQAPRRATRPRVLSGART